MIEFRKCCSIHLQIDVNTSYNFLLSEFCCFFRQDHFPPCSPFVLVLSLPQERVHFHWGDRCWEGRKSGRIAKLPESVISRFSVVLFDVSYTRTFFARTSLPLKPSLRHPCTSQRESYHNPTQNIFEASERENERGSKASCELPASANGDRARGQFDLAAILPSPLCNATSSSDRKIFSGTLFCGA